GGGGRVARPRSQPDRVLEEAAAEQDQHEPGPDRGGGDTARDEVTGPPGVVRRTAPARRDEAGSGLHGDGGDSRSGPRACTLDPAPRRTPQEAPRRPEG